MGFSLQELAFYVVGLCIIVFSVLSVTTGRILRAVTYLLFVLFGTSAIYGILGYTFLSAVQLMVYAGGIVVLYVFSVLLTNSANKMKYRPNKAKLITVALTTIIGTIIVMALVVSNHFALVTIPQGDELMVKEIGHALLSTEKYGFVLPFEVLSILLLSCMIGAIMISRRRK